jgi:hypothetical protein
MTATTWEPGLPLHSTRGHGGYLYNFRDDNERADHCMCSDAAVWTADPRTPLPGSARPMLPGDELGAFIDEWHAWMGVAS